MNRYVTVGLSVLAGAALFEAALLPGVMIGCAVVLAPRYLGRRLRPSLDAVRRATDAARPGVEAGAAGARIAEPTRALPEFRIGQAVAKTITFRIIVTTLDFSTNLLVIGELNTAAGLSAFNLVAGPLFYLGHEAAWNYLGPDERATVAVLPSPAEAKERALLSGFRISRALAKTITFRGIATVADFTANYVVVRDIATAAGLSAFGFVLGPFVYFAHEKAWDYYGSRATPGLVPQKLLPAPA